MSTYMTETEQVELIKNWWKKYHRPLLLAVSVLLLCISGVRYWQWQEQNKKEQSSDAYEHMMYAFSNNDHKAVRSYIHQLITVYPDTIYADTARLVQAKLDINAEHYDKAAALLKSITEHSKYKTWVDIARLRLARIWIFEKKYQQALRELDNINEPTYNTLKSELRGDIFYAQGHIQAALDAYQSAKLSMDKSGVTHLFLDMKQEAVLAAVHSYLPTTVVVHSS